MDNWKDLRKEIERYDYHTDPEYAKAASIAQQHNDIIKTEKKLSNRPPPLFVILHSLRSIMFPTFLFELTSEFLHQLTLVEIYRLKATEKAELAIKMNELFDDEAPLTDDTLRIFNETVKEEKAYRKLYLKVVMKCIYVDLHRYWVSASNRDFWVRWNEYFSFLRGPEEAKLSHNLHFTLSGTEISELHDTAVKVSNFMAGSTHWAEQHRESRSIAETFDSLEFNQKFPCPAILYKHLEYYLEVVQKSVTAVEESGRELFDYNDDN
ncbi:hypothetical protein CPC08DRAFT_705110 [Agrocybe pediades]|nr:hypothetical protein CPC08DRAFT_705110 [Agrocybe pediades]